MRKFFLKLIQKYFLKVDSNILPGDVICSITAENVLFEAVAIYYTYDLEPMLLAKDIHGSQIYVGKLAFYKRSVYVPVDQLSFF